MSQELFEACSIELAVEVESDESEKGVSGDFCDVCYVEEIFISSAEGEFGDLATISRFSMGEVSSTLMRLESRMLLINSLEVVDLSSL